MSTLRKETTTESCFSALLPPIDVMCFSVTLILLLPLALEIDSGPTERKKNFHGL